MIFSTVTCLRKYGASQICALDSSFYAVYFSAFLQDTGTLPMNCPILHGSRVSRITFKKTIFLQCIHMHLYTSGLRQQRKITFRPVTRNNLVGQQKSVFTRKKNILDPYIWLFFCLGQNRSSNKTHLNLAIVNLANYDIYVCFSSIFGKGGEGRNTHQ